MISFARDIFTSIGCFAPDFTSSASAAICSGVWSVTRSKYAHVIAQGFRHFALAVQSDEDRHGQRHLGCLAVLALNFAADEEIEFLLGGAELDVGLERDRIVGLQERVEQLVNGDGQIAGEA